MGKSLAPTPRAGRLVLSNQPGILAIVKITCY
jgi:hypothetical protein